MIELVQTCWACPEAYDIRHDGRDVGSIRLRHGIFRVDAEPSRETLFARNFSEPIGASRFPAGFRIEPEELTVPEHDSDGIFTEVQVRAAYLELAVRKVCEFHDIDVPIEFRMTILDPGDY